MIQPSDSQVIAPAGSHLNIAIAALQHKTINPTALIRPHQSERPVILLSTTCANPNIGSSNMNAINEIANTIPAVSTADPRAL